MGAWRVMGGVCLSGGERTDFFYGASKLMHVTAHPLVFVQHVRVKSLSTENEALKKSVS